MERGQLGYKCNKSVGKPGGGERQMNSRMGVYILVAHFMITIFLIGGYLYTVVIGNPDETLKNGILIVLGYWFGAAGMDKIKKSREVKEEAQ